MGPDAVTVVIHPHVLPMGPDAVTVVIHPHVLPMGPDAVTVVIYTPMSYLWVLMLQQ